MPRVLSPSLVVIAGPNGSGKTTLTGVLLAHEWLRGHTYINADEIAQRELGDWNADDTTLRAAQLADERRERCLAERVDFAYETVFSTPARVDFILRAKAAGYFIRLYFLATSSPEINVARVKLRIQQGGHGVPEEKIRSRYLRSLVNLRHVVGCVDRAYLYDNSTDDAAPVRWVRLRNGVAVQVLPGPIPNWIADMLAAR